MIMNAKRTVGVSLIGGLAITLLTGLLSNMPMLLVGAEHFGYPLAWLTRLVIAPEYFPWRADALAFVVDVVAWTILIAVVILLWAKMKRK